MAINKQQTGFKFGIHSLKVIREVATLKYAERTYKIVVVKTEQGDTYVSIRLYNQNGKFIKQLLIEPEIAGKVGSELLAAFGEGNSYA